MKKLIFAIVAFVCGVCSAGEMQENYCNNNNLTDCIKHFDRQCEAKNYVACEIVGALHYEQKKYSESKKYYEMVCDKANSKDTFQVERIDGSLTNKIPAIETMKIACGTLAKHYSNGRGVRQDYNKSLHYYKKACGLGNADSCVLAGGAYLLGKNVKKDLKIAKSYFEKSCEMQDGFGCGLLGAMYANGDGVAKNLSTAKELYLAKAVIWDCKVAVIIIKS